MQPVFDFLTSCIMHTVKGCCAILRNSAGQMRKQCAVVNLSKTHDWFVLYCQVPEGEKEYERNVLTDKKKNNQLPSQPLAEPLRDLDNISTGWKTRIYTKGRSLLVQRRQHFPVCVAITKVLKRSIELK